MNNPLGNFHRTIGETAQQRAIQEQEAAIEKQKEFFIEFGSSLFSRAAAYTNIIILAGYAGIFTIWNFTQRILPDLIVAIVGVLLLLSLFAFISFEIFKMISNAKFVFSLGSIVKPNMSPKQISAAIADFEKRCNLDAIRVAQIWPWALMFAVATGYSAAGILIIFFILSLFET